MTSIDHLFLLIIAVIHQGLSVLATYLAEQVGWTATNQMRRDLAEHVMDLDMTFHKQHTPGELIERIDGDVTALSNFFSAFVIKVVANFLLILGILVLLWRENVWVGLGLVEGLSQGSHRVGIDRVHRVGSVEGERRDTVADLVAHELPDVVLVHRLGDHRLETQLASGPRCPLAP